MSLTGICSGTTLDFYLSIFIDLNAEVLGVKSVQGHLSYLNGPPVHPQAEMFWTEHYNSTSVGCDLVTSNKLTVCRASSAFSLQALFTCTGQYLLNI